MFCDCLVRRVLSLFISGYVFSNILSYAEEIFGEPFDRDVIITEELRS